MVNIIDPILLVILSLFALRGYFKGLFRESFSLLGLLIGFMVAVRYDEPVAVLWSEYWKLSLIVLRILTFVGLFFVVYFTFSLTGWLLHRSAKFLFLQGVNRVGGVVLGMGKGAAILALVIFFLVSSPFMPQTTRKKIDESYLAPPLHYFAQGLIRIGKANLLPPDESTAREGEGLGYF
ncbi:CvpA family protein [bacterium]|nr:MAG: CvpA family protein [bacterium]